MNSLQKYFEELTAKYGDKVDMVSSKYDEETLALVPDAMKEFYRTYESVEKDCMYESLEELRKHCATEEKEDMILELMDFVGGFCSPHCRIYLD